MNARRITPNSAACLPSTLQALSRSGAPVTPEGGGSWAKRCTISLGGWVFLHHEERF
jgi:hypothetical protein